MAASPDGRALFCLFRGRTSGVNSELPLPDFFLELFSCVLTCLQILVLSMINRCNGRRAAKNDPENVLHDASDAIRSEGVYLWIDGHGMGGIS
jgi:hypothetical protein